VIAPLLGSHVAPQTALIKEKVRKEIRVEVNADDQGQMEAVIKTTSLENGETVVDEKVISGTEQEIQAAVEEMKVVKININKEEE
jgi:K(+)-stimulated pyrophosphate-energized sodium pump